MLLDAMFSFNKAGQGCFYTGLFDDTEFEKTYSMVYDCGTRSTKSYLRNEIWSFKSKLLISNNNTLNLLILSHFDEDHVNEVLTLLEGLTNCDRIILPYLYPEERLLVYFKQRERGIKPSSDYVEFLIDPISYLNQFNNIGEIIYIHGDEASGNNFEGGRETPNEPVDTVTASSFLITSDAEIKNNSLEFKPEFPELYNYRKKYPTLKIGVFRDKVRLTISGTWEFYFYNKRIDERAKVQEFVQRLRKSFPGLGKKNVSITNIRNLFENINKVQSIYRKIFNTIDLNTTSLIVYHSPINIQDVDDVSINNCEQFYNCCKVCEPFDHKMGVATLLTGDIYLKDLRLPNYIRDNYSKISFIQIPHHGSKTKWDFDAINKYLTIDPVYAIINFGLGNKHKHPAQLVVDSINNSSGWKIRLNHQLEAFHYSVKIDNSISN